MARGRAGSDRVYTRASVNRRRAASVPVDVGAGLNASNLMRAHGISHSAMDDSVAIKMASRKRDQQLLNNITNTLQANSAYSPHPFGNNLRQFPRRASVASIQRYAHRRPSVADIDDITADSQSARAFRDARNRAGRHIRASSVPPVPTYIAAEPLVRRTTCYPGYLESSIRTPPRRAFIDIDSPLMRTAGGASRPLQQLRNEGANYMQRAYQLKPIVRSYGRGTSEPPGVRRLYPGTRPVLGWSQGTSSSSSLAIRQAKQTMGRLEREIGVDDYASPYSYYDDAYAIEAPMATPIVVPTRVTSGMATRSLPSRRYSISGPPSFSGAAPRRPAYTGPSVTPPANTARLAVIEAKLLNDPGNNIGSAPPSYSELRSATLNARNKMDRHKVLLDRYLPIHMGPENEVEYEVEYKYGELAERMPLLQRQKARPDTGPSSLVAPYRPVAKAGRGVCDEAKPPMGYSSRPPISDTRKRCREVLCKVKNDPHYYN